MENLKKWTIGLFLGIIIISTGNPDKASAQARAGVTFQTFYDELEPHGRWIRNREYGYVWAPRVNRDFRPYATHGRWVMTEYGNTWVSDYSWGWAPFHYGRWTFDDFYGWIWIPDYEWGPAWVSWRHGGGYYGWAPLPPGVNINVSINIPAFRWVFVPQRYITSHRVYNYYVPHTRVVNIYKHTTIVNNYYKRDNRQYVYGPRRSEVERATRSKVSVHQISNAERPGRPEVQNNSVKIYRPDVSGSRQEVSRPVRATESSYSRNTGNSSSSSRGTAATRANAGQVTPTPNNATVGERPSRPERSPQTEQSNRNSGNSGRVSSENSRPQAQPQQSGNRPQRSQPSESRREIPQRTQSVRSSGNSQRPASTPRPSSREASGRPSRR